MFLFLAAIFNHCHFKIIPLIIFSAGTLSYGDPSIVFAEIYRVLKPNGFFIAVDSLNNNPLNYICRLFSVLRSRRSFSTIAHMPTIKSLYHHYFPIFESSYPLFW